jgi:hypothetical protein
MWLSLLYGKRESKHFSAFDCFELHHSFGAGFVMTTKQGVKVTQNDFWAP